MRIRSATAQDEGFVRDLAGEVFAPFGNYRPLLPKWFRTPGVLTFVSELGDERTGYVMLAFFEEGPSQMVADVLAIAVAPAFQGRGIGRMLLQHAVKVSEEAAERFCIRAIRLSVANTNFRARALFLSSGFVDLPGDFGTYEGGQKALHMERPIAQPEGAP
ncbi:MAG: GNAT family N-acetyltransferase [Myxococcales bacterium]